MRRTTRQRRVLLALGLVGFLVLSAVGTLLSRPLVRAQLVGAFGDPRPDQLIEAGALHLEGTLISRDPWRDGHDLISYEYYVEDVMYVGYLRIDPEVGQGWTRFGPIDVEVAATDPSISRVEGVVRAPRAALIDPAMGVATAVAVLQLVLAAGVCGVLILGLRRGGTATGDDP